MEQLPLLPFPRQFDAYAGDSEFLHRIFTRGGCAVSVACGNDDAGIDCVVVAIDDYARRAIAGGNILVGQVPQNSFRKAKRNQITPDSLYLHYVAGT